MKRKMWLMASVLSLVVVPVCLAASPWDGTWKLNEAKSQMTGDVFTLTPLANGGFHLSTPSHSADRDYPCDGSDYPVIGDRTGTCKKIDDKHYEMAGKQKGKLDWHGTSVVSADGKYLTNTATVLRPDGTTSTEVNKFERVGAGSGRGGTWRSVKSTSSGDDVMKITIVGDTMREETPAYKGVLIAKLDGSPAKMEGPEVQPGHVVRFKAESTTRLHFMVSLNGKPYYEGTRTLSADGKTLVEEEWETGNANSKQRYVYEKQ